MGIEPARDEVGSLRIRGVGRRRALAWLTIALVLKALAGCGSGWDPERSKLDDGDVATLSAPPADGRTPGTVPVDWDVDEGGATSIAAETLVRVLEDAGPEGDKRRRVRIQVVKGPEQGRKGTVPRLHLFRIKLANPDPAPAGQAVDPESMPLATDPMRGFHQNRAPVGP